MAVFTLDCSALPAASQVVAFHGHEAISALYRFTIGLVVSDGEVLAVDDAMSARATLSWSSDKGPQHYHGVLTAIEMVHAWGGHSLYRLTLEPELADLGRTHHSTIYVDTDGPQIWRSLVHARGELPQDYAEYALWGSYGRRQHVCQYRESNLSFLLRQLEREGAYFYFAHGGDVREPETLIVTDHKDHHQLSRSEPLRYVALTGDAALAGDCLDAWAMRAAAQPRDVATTDYDHLNPSLEVKGGPVAVASDGGGGMVYHGDDVYTPREAERQSTHRAEALTAARQQFVGNGSAHHLRAGYCFELVEHPHESMNGRYLAIEVHHYGNDGADPATLGRLRLRLPLGDQVYRCSVTAIAANVQYRQARTTRTPRIDGVARGFVDGPADSEYAQIDEHGRYKVAIQFDERWRSAPDGEGKCSTWVRMIQPHGGVKEGFHFPLRKGTEVMVSFIGGDPDRPIIMGVAPNAMQPSPVTESNHTQNVVQTGGENRIEMEDQDGQQYIDISTPPKDTFIHLGEPHAEHGGYIVEHTDGNHVVAIGGDQDTTVGGDQSTKVEGDRSIDVGGVQTVHVSGKVTETFDQKHTTIVGATRLEKIGGDELTKTTGRRSVHVGTDSYMNVAGKRDTIITAGEKHSVLADQKTFVAGTKKTETGGTWTQDIGGDVDLTCKALTIKAPGGITQTTGGDWHGFTSGYTQLAHGGWKNTITVGASTTAELSVKTSIHVGAKLDICAAFQLNAVAAVKVESVSGPTVLTAATTTESSPMWIRTGACTAIVSPQNYVSGAWIVI